MSQSYHAKSSRYFGKARIEIEPLLPAAPPAHVLEIGCGAGQTMAWLKAAGRVGHAVGIELFESAAVQAREHFDEVLVGDAEKLIDSAWGATRFDLVLCLDVLEHMIEPWRFVGHVRQRLAPGGALIVSVPNVRSLKVLVPLLLRGRFPYADEGILDRTHLRFFTRDSAIDMVSGAALVVERCIDHAAPGTRLARLNRWTFGHLSGLTAQQFLIKGTRPA